MQEFLLASSLSFLRCSREGSRGRAPQPGTLALQPALLPGGDIHNTSINVVTRARRMVPCGHADGFRGDIRRGLWSVVVGTPG